MPKPKVPKIDVNLLPKDPFFETPVGKMLRWALSVGRYIVIFTELVVIMSFATRFSLDRQVTDLNDSINQKQIIIESFGDFEAEIREIQRKIDQYQQIEQTDNIADVFPKLTAVTPLDVTLDTLELTSTELTMTGQTLSNNSLNLLINNLELSPDFSEVSVNTIESGDKKNPGLQFSISAVTQQPKLTKTTTKAKK